MVATAAAVLSGCTPSCEQACRKLLDCDLDAPRVALEECQASCETQEHLYQVWGDNEKQDAMTQQRDCIGDSTCDEIRDGACYDDEIYVF